MNSLSQNWVQCQFCVNLRLDLSRHVSPQYWAAALCLQQLSAALSSSLLTNQFISCFAISDEFFQNNRAGAGGGRNVTSHLLENWWSHECRDRHADIWTNISSHIPWNVRQIFHEHQISHQKKIKYHNILQQTVNVVLWKISQLLPMNSWIFLFSTIHRHHRNQCHEKFIWISLSSSHTNLISVNHQYQACFLLGWLQWLKIIVTKAVTTMMKRWPLYADNNDGQ